MKLSERIYRRLLRLYPRDFRDEYGEEMSLMFRDRASEGVLRLWLQVIRDLVLHVPEEHWSTFRQDLRYGVRMLLRKPAFAATIVATLALGIGANTAMYTIVHAVMLRPLEVREPQRLVRIYESNPGRNWPAFSASVPNYLSWKEQTRSLELAAFQGYAANWTGDRDAARLEGIASTASFFPVMGMTLQLGRWFLDEEQLAGRHRVVVLSDTLWKTRFGADRDVVSRTLVLNGESYNVIGVATAGLTVPTAPDVFVPLVLNPNATRGNRQYTVIGRLRPGFTAPQAQAEISTIAGRLEQQFPESNAGWNVAIVPLMHWLVSDEIRTALLVLLAAVGVVQLIACGNVANLLLARAEARRKEIAIRAALGAGASRISRQLLTESLLLSSIAGIHGIAVGYAIVAIARRSLVEIVPRANEISIDLNVLGFALVMSLLTGLLFGVTPMLQLGRMRTLDALHQAGRTSHGAPRSRLRASLVVAQLALATTLTIAAGLLVQSFARLQGEATGLDAESVVTARVALPQARYPDGARIAEFFSRLTASLQSTPGIEAAGVSSAIPMGPGSTTGGTVSSIDPTVATPNQSITSAWRSVDAGFFETLRIPLLRGRIFGPEDVSGRCCVFVLSQQTSRALYGDADPIGRQVRLNDRIGEVIGVVGDIRMKSIGDRPENVVYVPLAQGGRFGVFAMFVKTRDGSPEAARASIKERLREADPAVPPFGVRPMADWVDSSSARMRIRTGALAFLAAVGLGLAVVGIYGVLAYLVTLRGHEFGLRLALGAQPRRLLAAVLTQGLGLAVVGIGIGLAGALLLTELLETLLVGVAARDPLVFIGVPVLLLLAALAASYLPARRAACVDPLAALRAE